MWEESEVVEDDTTIYEVDLECVQCREREKQNKSNKESKE